MPIALSPHRIPIGVQTGLSVTATAGGLTVPTGKVPKGAIITVLAAPVRYWVDGTTPTATTGHRADVHDEIYLDSDMEVANFSAIRESGVSATLEITYYQ